jgi:hydroxymethylglutaryl-CoA reductase (NADPH)
MVIPSLILRQLYTFGSLDNNDAGFSFQLKNRLSDATLTGIAAVVVDGRDIPLGSLTLDLGAEQLLGAAELGPENAIEFPLGEMVEIHAEGDCLEKGKHRILLTFEVEPFGKLSFEVEDSIAEEGVTRVTVPYDKRDDYTEEAINSRREFVASFSGVEPEHIYRESFDPRMTKGNIENYTGVAQVPIGFAGPLRVNGEHAQGEFLIPLATTEGALVASYNRGMKVLNLAGGVACTVVDDCMQRAPVFVFDSARDAREFRDWVDRHIAPIRDAAEATSNVVKLRYIDTYLTSRFAFLRFNYRTGDAAGQNMVGRATFAACSYILDSVGSIRKFYLESNLATDKKTSQINVMRTRGKRVVAETTLPRALLVQHLRVDPESLFSLYNTANVGAFLSGASNNGAQSPNAITAMFIATGQDVANVAESSAAILYAEITPGGDLYMSLTIPSLIVATYGGGTGLATQNECLEIMGCAGKGKVNKLAEIIAGVALAGEISLSSAVSSLDWVSSHEKYGRNR